MDIETLKGMFLYVDFDINTKKFVSFKLTKRKSEIDKLVKYLVDSKPDYLVGYNNLNFDAQVIEFIIRENKKWFDKNNDEILNLIYKKSQRIIEDLNFDVFPPYPERDLSVKQMDLFKIHHFDNKNRRTSLKWLEFMMDMDNIEEMPYPHWQEDFTEEQENEIIKYCKNDVLSTYKFYLYTTGEVSNKYYSGRNKIQDRFDLIAELDKLYPGHGFSVNYSDSKIGDELNKLTYMELSGIKDKKKLYELKKSRKPTKRFKYKDCIPEYVQFQTPEFSEFYKSIANNWVALSGKGEEFEFIYKGTTYTIAQGGIHSSEKNTYYTSANLANKFLRDADVGSQYPNAIRKRKLYPKHLGEYWTKVGQKNIETRLTYKVKSSEHPKYKGLSEMYKLALNAGYFGKTLENTNWQYGPEVGYFCTIGNQFEILMLIEMLELEGIHCVSANTDGIVCLFDKELNDKYYEVCHKWEKIVGNEDLGKLEYADYKILIQESVNHYWAMKDNGEVKIKGRFLIEDSLHKNNTDKVSRIERKALEKYFLEGIPVEETIRNEKDKFMFCIGAKASKNYFYRTIKDNISEDYFLKVMRYYVSINGKKLLKIKKAEADTDGPKITKIVDGYLTTICNDISKFDFNTINYQYYIDGANTIIENITKVKINKNQLQLF